MSLSGTHPEYTRGWNDGYEEARAQPQTIWVVTVHYDMEDQVSGLFVTEAQAEAFATELIVEHYRMLTEEMFGTPRRAKSRKKVLEFIMENDDKGWSVNVAFHKLQGATDAQH